MKTRLSVLVLGGVLALTACGGNAPPTSAASSSRSEAVATVNGNRVTLNVTPTEMLNAAVASEYGITRAADSTLMLVSVRDAQGNAVAQPPTIIVRAAVSPATPMDVALKPVEVAGFRDLVGTFTAKPPARVQFELEVRDGGAAAKQSFTRDLLPR